MKTQCKAIKRDGERCPHEASMGGYCVKHINKIREDKWKKKL